MAAVRAAASICPVLRRQEERWRPSLWLWWTGPGNFRPWVGILPPIFLLFCYSPATESATLLILLLLIMLLPIMLLLLLQLLLLLMLLSSILLLPLVPPV